MAKHFTKANMSDFYAAMGNSRKKPHYGRKKVKSVAEAIVAARAAEARQAKINSGKKK